jgi:hypothetical protein
LELVCEQLFILNHPKISKMVLGNQAEIRTKQRLLFTKAKKHLPIT